MPSLMMDCENEHARTRATLTAGGVLHTTSTSIQFLFLSHPLDPRSPQILLLPKQPHDDVSGGEYGATALPSGARGSQASLQ